MGKTRAAYRENRSISLDTDLADMTNSMSLIETAGKFAAIRIIDAGGIARGEILE